MKLQLDCWNLIVQEVEGKADLARLARTCKALKPIPEKQLHSFLDVCFQDSSCPGCNKRLERMAQDPEAPKHLKRLWVYVCNGKIGKREDLLLRLVCKAAPKLVEFQVSSRLCRCFELELRLPQSGPKERPTRSTRLTGLLRSCTKC